jgi:hypothetical protein
MRWKYPSTARLFQMQRRSGGSVTEYEPVWESLSIAWRVNIFSSAWGLASADIRDAGALVSQLAAALATVDDAALRSELVHLPDSQLKLAGLEAVGRSGSASTADRLPGRPFQ